MEIDGLVYTGDVEWVQKLEKKLDLVGWERINKR